MSIPEITVLDRSNQVLGAFAVDEVKRRLASGEFAPDQLAHTEGLDQWTPLATVISRFPAELPLPPIPQAITHPPYTATPVAPTTVYGGFWLRFAAYFIDTILVCAVIYGTVAVLLLIADPQNFLRNMSSDDDDTTPFWVKLIIVPVFIAGPILYFTLLESGPRQATVGKMALGLIVTDLQGQRISRGHALGRTLAKVVTGMTCFFLYFGYIMAGFTDRKQALHDFIASTLVLRRRPGNLV